MKIAIVANCQAPPVEDILKKMSTKAALIGNIIVHLAKEQDVDAHYVFLQRADIISAQLVPESYPVEHVSTDRLGKEFPGKLISWSNICARGQCPDLSYIVDTHCKSLSGPLRDYHLRTILPPLHDSQLNLFEYRPDGSVAPTWRKCVSTCGCPLRLHSDVSPLHMIR